MIPRIPFARDFRTFADAGVVLAEKKLLGKSAEIRRNTLSNTPSKYPKQKHWIASNRSEE